jgi:pimeloyl-ACP methyl ester carboxylesterase
MNLPIGDVCPAAATSRSAGIHDDTDVRQTSDLASGASTGKPGPDELFVALHCSGSNGGQWRQLGDMLGARHTLVAPEHYGSDQTGPWPGERVFTLADEATRTIALIDQAERKLHLVGHSYGGGVALHAALARPHHVSSLSLYEPSAFHLLKDMGAPGAKAFAEIMAISGEAGRNVVTGDYRRAAACFVDYWGGDGAWSALRPEHQVTLTRWAPKAPLDFAALMEEPTQASAYSDLRFPVLLMRGEHAPAPTRLVVERLAALLQNARVVVIDGAGHMGPFTHRSEVNALIISHAIGQAHTTTATLPDR